MFYNTMGRRNDERLRKMNEQKDKYIQQERNKIRQKRYEQAIKDAKTFKEKSV